MLDQIHFLQTMDRLGSMSAMCRMFVTPPEQRYPNSTFESYSQWINSTMHFHTIAFYILMSVSASAAVPEGVDPPSELHSYHLLYKSLHCFGLCMKCQHVSSSVFENGAEIRWVHGFWKFDGTAGTYVISAGKAFFDWLFRLVFTRSVLV